MNNPRRPVQYFSQEYLQQCKAFSTEAILVYLENFRLMQGANNNSKLISLKIPEAMLESFKAKSKLHGIKYQTQIKHLMKDWLED